MPDALQTYMRELRKQRHLSQHDVAHKIGLSLRAFSDWETGKSEELKGTLLVRLVEYLQGSWDQITRIVLENMEPDEAAKLAHEHVNSNRSSAPQDAEISQFMEQILADERLLMAVLTFWAGWKAHKLT